MGNIISAFERGLAGVAGDMSYGLRQAMQGSSAPQMAAETLAITAQEEHRLRFTAFTSKQFCDTNEWDTVSFATESKPKSIRQELQEETDKWLEGFDKS